MRPDIDLQFLANCSNADLRTLCDILTHDKEGNVRLSEQLTNSDAYLRNYPDNCSAMWQDIAKEVCLYGGNSIANIFRHGRGPSYESIVADVCRKLDIECDNEYVTAAEMEQLILEKFLDKALDELSPEQLKSIMKEIDPRKRTYTKQAVLAAVLATRLVNKRLFTWVFDYIIQVVTKLLVGRGVMMAGLGVIGRNVRVLFGPVGWALFGGWTLWDITGPAYRVIIPAILQIAYMRTKCDSNV